MVNQYLRAFVIGSSFFVFIPYFLAVKYLSEQKFTNFSYENYTLYAPIGLGLYNIFSLYVANKMKISKRYSLFLLSIIAPSVVAIGIYTRKAYNYTSINQWFNHIWKLYLVYFIVFNFILYYLDKYV
jgi:hypothetical protein